MLYSRSNKLWSFSPWLLERNETFEITSSHPFILLVEKLKNNSSNLLIRGRIRIQTLSKRELWRAQHCLWNSRAVRLLSHPSHRGSAALLVKVALSAPPVLLETEVPLDPQGLRATR